MLESKKIRELGLAVIETEAKAVATLKERINEDFIMACKILMNCKGRIIVLGMGKSGHIGSKIASTFASTGSPAYFVHPAEASHGDLGMITREDVILALSYSGESSEIISILPFIKRLGIPLIAMTGKPTSTLAREAIVHLNVSVEMEACPLGLAPTTSTTVSLVMGDALAVALLETKGFSAEDFALSHPGGSLGRKLLLHVQDIMRTEQAIPIVSPTTCLIDAILVMCEKGLGMTCIVDEKHALKGIYTDGDIRRTLTKGIDIHTTLIQEVMSINFKTVPPKMLAAEALQLMELYKITVLIVINDDLTPVGIIHLHDLLQAGIA
ncbi:MAG: Arabinose 5-phosphate isomerase KdsD [Legionellaceae bacterium]